MNGSMGYMTLKELGQTYLDEAATLEQLIANCKARRALAMQAGDSVEATRQEQLIELHKHQRDELERIGIYLRRYYE